MDFVFFVFCLGFLSTPLRPEVLLLIVILVLVLVVVVQAQVGLVVRELRLAAVVAAAAHGDAALGGTLQEIGPASTAPAAAQQVLLAVAGAGLFAVVGCRTAARRHEVRAEAGRQAEALHRLRPLGRAPAHVDALAVAPAGPQLLLGVVDAVVGRSGAGQVAGHGVLVLTPAIWLTVVVVVLVLQGLGHPGHTQIPLLLLRQLVHGVELAGSRGRRGRGGNGLIAASGGAPASALVDCGIVVAATLRVRGCGQRNYGSVAGLVLVTGGVHIHGGRAGGEAAGDHALVVVAPAVGQRQGQSQLLPELLVVPLDASAGPQIVPHVHVDIPLGQITVQDEHHALPALHQLVQGTLVLEAAPLVVEEVLGQDQNKLLGTLGGFNQGVRNVGINVDIPVVQTQPVANIVLQGLRQDLVDEVLVLQAVGKVGVVGPLLVELVHESWRLVAEVHQAAGGVGPHLQLVAVAEEAENETEEAHKGARGHQEQGQQALNLVCVHVVGHPVPKGALGSILLPQHTGGVVVDAAHPGGVDNLLGALSQIIPESGQVAALAAPLVLGQADFHQVGISAQLPDFEVHQSVAVQAQHLQFPQHLEAAVGNAGDSVGLQIQLAQILQIVELIAL